MLKTLYKSDERNNNVIVYMTKSGLNNFKNEIKKMSEDDIKIEKQYKIVDIVEKILTFNEKKSTRKRLKNFNPKLNA